MTGDPFYVWDILAGVNLAVMFQLRGQARRHLTHAVVR